MTSLLLFLARARNADPLCVLGRHSARRVLGDGGDGRFTGGFVVEGCSSDRRSADVQHAAPGYAQYQYPFHRCSLSVFPVWVSSILSSWIFLRFLVASPPGRLVPTFALLRAWRFFFLMAAVWLRGLNQSTFEIAGCAR